MVTIEDFPADQSGVDLTTVILPRYDLGRLAGELLQEALADPRINLAPRSLECHLHLGQSTAKPG